MRTKQKNQCQECATYKTASCYDARCAPCIVDKKADPQCVSVFDCRERTAIRIKEMCLSFKQKMGDWND